MFFWHIIKWLQIASVVGYWYLRHEKPVFYRKTLQRLRQENILFTKIFQALANTTNLELDTVLRNELRPYTTNASYTESEINYEAIDTVEETYGVLIDRHVANSGMIALIFNGTDSSGNPIILKLKRNDIYNRLKTGCDDTSELYRWIAYWTPKNIIVRALLPFFYNLDEILEQCDFNREIRNMLDAREDYAELGFIHIPEPLNNPATPNTEFILMNRIEGTHSLPPSTTEEERLVFLFKFCLFASFSYVSNAILHVDLHAGNMIFMPNGDIGVIDFGLAIRFSDDEHDMMLTIAEIVRGSTAIEDVELIDTFKNMFLPPLLSEEISDREQFLQLARNIFQNVKDYVNADELNLIDNIDKLGAFMNREITMIPNLYKFILGMMCMGQLYSIMGRVYEDADILRNIEMRALNQAFMMVV